MMGIGFFKKPNYYGGVSRMRGARAPSIKPINTVRVRYSTPIYRRQTPANADTGARECDMRIIIPPRPPPPPPHIFCAGHLSIQFPNILYIYSVRQPWVSSAARNDTYV